MDVIKEVMDESKHSHASHPNEIDEYYSEESEGEDEEDEEDAMYSGDVQYGSQGETPLDSASMYMNKGFALKA